MKIIILIIKYKSCIKSYEISKIYIEALSLQMVIYSYLRIFQIYIRILNGVKLPSKQIDLITN